MITAEQAGQQLKAKNKKIIAPFPKHLMKQVPPIHIYNVGKKTWVVPLGGWGIFTIQGREEGQRYSKPVVVTGIMAEGIPTDMNKIEHRFEDGMAVAMDIIGSGPFKDPSQNLAKYGVFISAGEVPTEQELRSAEAKVRESYVALVQEADTYHSQGPMHAQNITAEHRAALDELNMTRPWHEPIKQMDNCPGCGNPVVPGVAVCGGKFGCGAILDQDKALALGLIQPVPEQVKTEKPKRA